MSQRDPTNLPVFLTLPEVAQVLKVSVRTVERAIARGELKAVHIGRCVRVNERDLGDLGKALAVEPRRKTSKPVVSELMRKAFPNSPAWRDHFRLPEDEP
jgi:excisionase family DNA binding protein